MSPIALVSMARLGLHQTLSLDVFEASWQLFLLTPTLPPTLHLAHQTSDHVVWGPMDQCVAGSPLCETIEQVLKILHSLLSDY